MKKTMILGIVTTGLLLTGCGDNSIGENLNDSVGIDNTPPVITIIGDNPIMVGYGVEPDKGATALDDIDGVVSVVATKTLPVGDTFTIVYTATDSSGNTAEAIRKVVILSDAVMPSEFLTKWNVEESLDREQNLTVNLPIGSVNYDYDAYIEWGDGRSTHFVWEKTDAIPVGGNPVVKHKYTRAGTYYVNITGTYPHFQVTSGIGNEEKLLEVLHWGDIEVKNLSSSYNGAKNLKITATDTPNLAVGIDMRYAFAHCGNLDADFSGWDTSKTSNMTGFLTDTNLSQESYDGMWLSWAEQGLQTGVRFDALNKHSAYITPVLDDIRNAYSWVINDGGEL